jgi:hypothetical protein
MDFPHTDYDCHPGNAMIRGVWMPRREIECPVRWPHRDRLSLSDRFRLQVSRPVQKRTRVVGVFPNRASCERLIGAILVEQHEKGQLEERPYFSVENV